MAIGRRHDDGRDYKAIRKAKSEPEWEETAHGRVRRAQESDTVGPACDRDGTVIKWGVLPKCELNRGTWYCITHEIGFQNQLQKDFHIGHGDHVLAWMCFEHGAEVP